MADNSFNLFLNRGSWNMYDAGTVDRITGAMEAYGAEAERVVNDVIHGEGALEIRRRIANLLPESGRKWRGKQRPARTAMPAAFDQDEDVLAVTIAARDHYHYLYFPDDGSNTRRHVGNQQFMLRGAEAAADKIIDICLGRLAEAFGG